MNRNLFNAFIMLVLLPACSTTPGDAAYRSGNMEQAADLYLAGAEDGDHSAAFKLGLLVYNGAVSAERFGNGVSWFQRACEAGELVACHNAGVAFEYGEGGVEKNLKLAREF